MKRALFLLVVAALFLPACGGTDRPEGVVERWLVSLNQGKAGEPEKYAPDDFSQRILPNWQTRDPGDLDVIEVGKGSSFDIEPVQYDVPFRVERGDGTEISMIARVVPLRRGSSPTFELGIFRILPADAGSHGLLQVPSKGGERIGHASPTVWLAAVGIAIALILLSVLLMSTVGREARVSP